MAVVAVMLAAGSCSCSNNKKAECTDSCCDKKKTECCEKDTKCAGCDKADECGEAAVPCDAEKCANCEKAEGCDKKAEGCCNKAE